MSIEHSDKNQDLEWVERRWVSEENASPPDLLDQAVLNTARRAIPAKRKRPARWFGGLATASVALLAISLVFLQEPGVPPEVEVGDADSTIAPAEESMIRAAPLDEKRQDAVVAPAAAPLRKESFRAPEAASTDRTGVTAMADQAAEADSPIDPDTWLEELLGLHEQGAYEALARELEAFRSVYPDFELPPALQDFAEQENKQP